MRNRTYLSIGVVFFVTMLMFGIGNVYADTTPSNPYVHTTQTPNGVSVTMDLPNNFKGQVYTVYKDGKWQSYATTTPISQADITVMNKQLQAQQKAFDQLFQAQQQLFDQQQAMFKQMFNVGWW